MNSPAYNIIHRPFLHHETDALDHFSIKGIVKKATSTIKDVVSDSAKLAVNSVTTPLRAVTGREPIYTADEMKTGFGKTGSTVQQLTTEVGKGIVANVPGGSSFIPPSGDTGYIPDAPPAEQEQTIGDFIQANPIAVGASVVGFILLLILILK